MENVDVFLPGRLPVQVIKFCVNDRCSLVVKQVHSGSLVPRAVPRGQFVPPFPCLQSAPTRQGCDDCEITHSL